MINAEREDGSWTRCGAISTPTANPTAATQSQNSFRPKNKITTPMSTPTIAVEGCIGGGAVRTAIEPFLLNFHAGCEHENAECCSVRCPQRISTSMQGRIYSYSRMC